MNRGQRRSRWLAQHRNAIRTAKVATHSLRTTRVARSEPVTSVPLTVPFSGQLHIEELVLHGFPATAGPGIGEATQQEFMRMLTVRGMPAEMMRDTTYARARSFQLPPDAKPKAIGALVANAVYGGRKR